MTSLQLIQHGAIWGTVFGLVFCAATLLIGWINVAMLVNEYPPDVRSKFGAMDAATRKQANLASLPLLLILGVIVAFALATLRKQTDALTMFDTLIVTLTLFQMWNLIDFILLDWFLLMTLRPRFMILPGTEGMAGYRDLGFHFRKFLNGIVLTLILSGIVTFVSMVVEWKV